MKKYIFIVMLLNSFLLAALESEDRSYLEANTRFQNQSYNLAYQKYSSFIEAYPESRHILNVKYKKALCLYYMGKYNNAVSEFEIIKNKYKRSSYIVNINFWEALCNFKLKEYEKAVLMADQYLSESTDLVYKFDALKCKILGLVLLDDLEKAEESAYEYYKERNASFESLKILYYILFKKDNYQEIISLYNKHLNNEYTASEIKELLFYKAESEFDLKNYSQAEKDYKKILENSKPRLLALIRLYIIYKDKSYQSGIDEIISELEKVSRLEGDSELLQEFWLRVGIETFYTGNTEAARTYLLKLDDNYLSEDYIELKNLYLAAIYISGSYYKEAVTLLENSAFSVYTENASYYTAESYTAMEKYAEAENFYNSIIVLDSGSEYFRKALIRKSYNSFFQGKKELAAELLEKSINSVRSDSDLAVLLKLKAEILFVNKKYSEALAAFDRYFIYKNEDIASALKKLKCLYYLKNWNRLFREADFIEKNYKTDVLTKSEIKYFKALSFLARNMYKDSLKHFKDIDTAKLSGKYKIIIPYVYYYSGWTLYKQSSFSEASEYFEKASAYDFKLKDDSYYFMGWCLYSLSEYKKAISVLDYFKNRKADLSLRFKADFIRARSYKDLNQPEESLAVLKNIYSVSNEMSDKALFEAALINVSDGKIDEGVILFEKLINDYPESNLKTEAAFRIAEAYYINEDFKKALSEFRDFRRRYPGSLYEDSALYWAGLSAVSINEKYKALLLWEILIGKYNESSFRYDAMLKSADILFEDSRHSEALVLYEKAAREYSGKQNIKEASVKAEKAKLILSGKTDREAELSIVIGKENGTESHEGRMALISLSKIYIYSNNKSQKKFNKYLEEISKITDDPEAAANAGFMLGEYKLKNGAYSEAAAYFIKAAFAGFDDKDFIARSVLRAAESAAMDGNKKESRRMTEIIFKNYPDSIWSEKAAELLKVNK